MRLWHYKLIPVLPRQQLLGQWREICAISKVIATQKTINHPLVAKVVSYPAWMFMAYEMDIKKEIERRGYNCNDTAKYNLFDNTMIAEENGYFADDDSYDFMQYMNDPFPGWHNDRYLRQCYYNLQEKHDCNLISDEEWDLIEKRMDVLNVFVYC